MNDMHVDLIGINGMTQGKLAAMLANNGRLNAHAMRPWIEDDGETYVSVYKGGDPKKEESYSVKQIQTNGTLRREEWMALDEAIVEIRRGRLGGVDDLISKGLTYNLGNAMGTTVLEWHDVSDAMEAEMSMDGVTRGKGDRVDFKHNYLPIPILHVDYEINARVLAASRNMGNPLDTTSAERAARRILEKQENMLFTDTTYSFGAKDSRDRNTIYSYVNYPDRNILSLGTHWNDLSVGELGDKIIDDVVRAKSAMISKYFYGPFQLYIPTAYETVLDKDYNQTTPGTTIRERIMKIDKIAGIKVIDTLPADNILMVQLTSDVVRLVQGMGLTNIEMKTEFDMVTKYKVMAIQVPQIRSDQEGRCGIVHMA